MFQLLFNSGEDSGALRQQFNSVNLNRRPKSPQKFLGFSCMENLKFSSAKLQLKIS